MLCPAPAPKNHERIVPSSRAEPTGLMERADECAVAHLNLALCLLKWHILHTLPIFSALPELVTLMDEQSLMDGQRAQIIGRRATVDTDVGTTCHIMPVPWVDVV